ncbi:hypothetical protein C8J57DRAFT_233422 [Mycena rebaudengoi]|nr:hypothetical protein C8J57DRAFT_477728 [Mycena rebaudengoi]KAJ7224000.1 hypothetical protein C8J57DRAFT_233422 [Mycena rebaudengoi]
MSSTATKQGIPWTDVHPKRYPPTLIHIQGTHSEDDEVLADYWRSIGHRAHRDELHSHEGHEYCKINHLFAPNSTSQLHNYLPVFEHISHLREAAIRHDDEGVAYNSQHDQAGNYIRCRIHHALRIFVGETNVFLRILHTTRSLVSGSLPLTVLCGGHFKPDDLDLYVPASQEDTLLALLDLHFSCKILATSNGVKYGNAAITTVRWLSGSNSACNINVMTCVGEDATSAIWHFHSTTVMNFISSLGIYCAYPNLTLNRIGIPSAASYDTSTNNSPLEGCLQKYRHRGFTFQSTPDTAASPIRHLCYRNTSCPQTIRTLHDGAGLFVPLLQHNEEIPEGIYDGCHSSIWSLGGPPCQGRGYYHNLINYEATSLKGSTSE